jgi:hypothetical protein
MSTTPFLGRVPAPVSPLAAVSFGRAAVNGIWISGAEPDS